MSTSLGHSAHSTESRERLIAFHVMRAALLLSYVFFAIGLAASLTMFHDTLASSLIIVGVACLIAAPVLRVAVLFAYWSRSSTSRALLWPAGFALLLFIANVLLKK